MSDEDFSGNQQPASTAFVGGLKLEFRTVTIEDAQLDIACESNGDVLEEEVIVDFPGQVSVELVGTGYSIDIENVESHASNFRASVRPTAPV